MSTHIKQIDNNVVRHLSKVKVPAPHTLMELSCKQFKRCQPNSISLVGLYETEKTTDMKPCVMYKEVIYGSALLPKKC